MAARKNPGIVLFDGTCAFCEGSVKFIARRDPAGHFRFGASQSPQAAGLLTTYGLTRETARSLILIERLSIAFNGGAAHRVADDLPWSPCERVARAPTAARRIYLSATIRHRLAGSTDAL
jgi:predicted DCC family thiol-disulfide oxidoreductase YuxK